MPLHPNASFVYLKPSFQGFGLLGLRVAGGYIVIMEKKMETTIIYRVILG